MPRGPAPASPRRLAFAALVVLAAGCQLVSGIDRYEVVEDAGPPTACTPKETRPCYGGDPPTRGVGACKDGLATCKDDGSGWGECAGDVRPSNEADCAAIVDTDCDGKPPVCTGDLAWDHAFGGSGDDDAAAVTLANFGRVLFAASFHQDIDFGGGALSSAGGSDAAVVVLDSSGAHRFSRRFGNSNDDRGNGVAADHFEAVVIAGSFQGSLDLGDGVAIPAAGDADVFAGTLDAAGAPLWHAVFGDDAFQEATALAGTGSDDAVIAGTMAGAITAGPDTLATSGPQDLDGFVVLLDPTGKPAWGARIHDAAGGEQRALAIAVDKGENAIAGGEGEGALDFGAGPVKPDPGPGRHAFLAKWHTDGALAWSRVFPGAGGDQRVAGVAVAPGGDVLVAGAFAGTITLDRDLDAGGPKKDAFVARLDASGKVLWSVQLGEPGGDQEALAIASDAWGNVIVAGTFEGELAVGPTKLVSAGGADAFVVKLRPTGVPVWARRAGDGADQRATGVAAGGDGYVTVVGSFAGSVDWGDGPRASKGGRDIFVAHLHP